MRQVSKKEAIQAIVRTAVVTFADSFKTRHEAEHEDPNGTINMKIHNVFIAELGPEIKYYTALVRSLDSSLGNMLETMAIEIAKLSFDVKRSVKGPLSHAQTSKIAEILEKYKRGVKTPEVKDYLALRIKPKSSKTKNVRHDSDYYLIDKKTYKNYLIELKIGGDLDNKKARSEKEAILEQYAILSNTLKDSDEIKIYFATAYNRFGENKPWKQERVKQFFADEELLIGKDFWNFVCQSNEGYMWVLEAYRQNAEDIKDALESIKRKYLKEN